MDSLFDFRFKYKALRRHLSPIFGDFSLICGDFGLKKPGARLKNARISVSGVRVLSGTHCSVIFFIKF